MQTFTSTKPAVPRELESLLLKALMMHAPLFSNSTATTGKAERLRFVKIDTQDQVASAEASADVEAMAEAMVPAEVMA